MTTLMKVVLLLLLCIGANPLHAEIAVVFGPSPRALDNRTLFAPNTAPIWRNLQDAGVQEVLLNGTFLARTELRQRSDETGMRPMRPDATYLRDTDLRDLARLQHELDLQVSYEAGAGLAGEVCDPSLAPEERGRRAAEREFNETLTRLRSAGISIFALNVDGPFLRLIEGSSKRGSCEWLEKGLESDAVVRTVQFYLQTIRDLAATANVDNKPPLLRLVVNLPNWQIRNLPSRQAKGNKSASVDLADVMIAFGNLQSNHPNPVLLSEVVIDYPYALVLENEKLFRDRTKHLWNATRGLNGISPGPSFGFITNTLAYTNACLKKEPKADVAFLPYVRGGQPISEKCQRAQTGEYGPVDNLNDSDTDYLRDSLAYARALRPGGTLAAQLIVSDGTAVSDHISHFYMQSWGINPLRNLWFADKLANDLQESK